VPALGCMGSKSLQLEGLILVRVAAVASFKKLNDEEERFRRLLSQLDKARHRSHNQIECTTLSHYV